MHKGKLVLVLFGDFTFSEDGKTAYIHEVSATEVFPEKVAEVTAELWLLHSIADSYLIPSMYDGVLLWQTTGGSRKEGGHGTGT